MTDKQKYAIKLAINTMNKHFGRHCNTVYGNLKTGISVGYGEAINILSDMLSNADSHTCNCQHNSNPRDNEPCCRCDSRQTNADKIRNMSDEDLAEWLTNMCDFEKNEEPYKSIYNLDTEHEEEIHDSYGDLLKWLQSEAE